MLVLDHHNLLDSLSEVLSNHRDLEERIDDSQRMTGRQSEDFHDTSLSLRTASWSITTSLFLRTASLLMMDFLLLLLHDHLLNLLVATSIGSDDGSCDDWVGFDDTNHGQCQEEDNDDRRIHLGLTLGRESGRKNPRWPERKRVKVRWIGIKFKGRRMCLCD